MADGSNRPIKDVNVGDKVVATEPNTGQTAAQPVTALHRNRDLDMTEVKVTDARAGPGRTATLKTTQHHPFWNQSTKTWTNAGDLKTGHQLRTSTGDTETVVAVTNRTHPAEMRDLTIAQTHTYYVLAGDQPVLVHNTTCTSLPSKHTDEFIVLGRREDINVARSWDNHEVLSLPTGTWSLAKNDAWVAGAIAKQQKVYLSSPLTNDNLFNGGIYNNGTTVYAREIGQFMDAGYTFNGDYMLPPALRP